MQRAGQARQRVVRIVMSSPTAGMLSPSAMSAHQRRGLAASATGAAVAADNVDIGCNSLA